MSRLLCHALRSQLFLPIDLLYFDREKISPASLALLKIQALGTEGPSLLSSTCMAECVGGMCKSRLDVEAGAEVGARRAYV